MHLAYIFYQDGCWMLGTFLFPHLITLVIYFFYFLQEARLGHKLIPPCIYSGREKSSKIVSGSGYTRHTWSSITTFTIDSQTLWTLISLQNFLLLRTWKYYLRIYFYYLTQSIGLELNCHWLLNVNTFHWWIDQLIIHFPFTRTYSKKSS